MLVRSIKRITAYGKAFKRNKKREGKPTTHIQIAISFITRKNVYEIEAFG